MFGMGTGGSLRLLSPETKLSLDSFAAARSRHPVGHQRPPVCLRSDSRSSRPPRFAPQPCPPHPQNRTGSSSVHRLTKALHFALIETFYSLLSHKPLAPGFPGSRSHWTSFAHGFPQALPVPCSLFPFLDQALDRLVSSSSIRYRTFTDDLSTLSSSRGLTCSKQWQFYSPGGLHA